MNDITTVKNGIQLESQVLGEELSPLLMEQAPAALATGIRCMDHGNGFYWCPFSPPFMVRPDGTVLPHVVEDYLPYLYERKHQSATASERPAIGLPCTTAPGDSPGAGTPEGGSLRAGRER